jgi:hypothetical protein
VRRDDEDDERQRRDAEEKNAHVSERIGTF